MNKAGELLALSCLEARASFRRAQPHGQGAAFCRATSGTCPEATGGRVRRGGVAGWRASWGRGGWPGVPGGVAGRLGGRREVLLTPVPRRPHAAPTPPPRRSHSSPAPSQAAARSPSFTSTLSAISHCPHASSKPASGTRLLHIALAVVKGQSGERPLEVTGGHGRSWHSRNWSLLLGQKCQNGKA